jgi:hypothetical protein
MGRPPIGKVAMTSTERVHRFRAKHRQDKPETKLETKQSAALEAKIRELEAELARERQRHENSDARVRKLEAELARERTRCKMLEEGLVAAPRPRESKPKVEKPPLPPDEQRERIIKGLRTQVRNLRAERDYIISTRIGVMTFKTQNAIAKVLHPDSREHASEADKDEAYKLFNAWKADKDKAHRTAKS